MELTEFFEDEQGNESLKVECYPEDGGAIVTLTQIGIEGEELHISSKLGTLHLGRLNGFLSLCLEAIRRMEELKEQQDG